MRISKDGYDAENDDVRYMVMDTDYPTLKIATQGTFNLTMNSLGGSYNEVTHSINHGLNYKPTCKFGAVIGSQAIEFHGQTIFTNSGVLDYFFGLEANPILASDITDNTIDFRFIAPDDIQGSATVTINYIIFLDEF
jgi:hypothetical protein